MNMQVPILDVRDARAFELGHAPGAANIPLAELPSRMHELPAKGRRLVIFHPEPATSQAAAELLESRGYQVAIQLIANADLTEKGPTTVHLWSPSAFLVEAWEMIRPQLPARPRVVDLGCGSGREAVWLAMRGAEVEAVDVLPDALQKATCLAAGCGVRIHARCLDLDRSADLTPGAYDVACLFRFTHREVMASVPQLLVENGFVIIEAFHARDVVSGKQGRRAQQLLGDGELAGLLRGMKVVQARDGVEREGRWFSQLVARRFGSDEGQCPLPRSKEAGSNEG